MKIAIVVPFFMGAFSASAQTTAPKTLLEIIKEQPATFQPAFIRTTAVSPQATLLSETEMGKIYALPLDNMPCLVPPKATAAVIPNAARFTMPGNRIPNASGVHPVLPKR